MVTEEHRKIDADVAFFIPIMPYATQPKLAVDVRTVNPSTIASKKDKAYLLANKQAAVNHADAQKFVANPKTSILNHVPSTYLGARTKKPLRCSRRWLKRLHMVDFG